MFSPSLFPVGQNYARASTPYFNIIHCEMAVLIRSARRKMWKILTLITTTPHQRISVHVLLYTSRLAVHLPVHKPTVLVEDLRMARSLIESLSVFPVEQLHVLPVLVLPAIGFHHLLNCWTALDFVTFSALHLQQFLILSRV